MAKVFLGGDKYHNIRNLVTLHDHLMNATNIQLYELNQTTLLTL